MTGIIKFIDLYQVFNRSLDKLSFAKGIIRNRI